MKKILPAIFVFCFAIPAFSQSVGFSAYGLGFFSRAPVAIDPRGYTSRTLGRTNPFSPGLRIEANAMMVGTRPAMFGYSGIGFSYFLPHSDSAYYVAVFKNGGSIPVVGTVKSTCTEFSLRIAYDIPQEFNEFLSIHVGFGLGFFRKKMVNVLPEKSTSFNHDISEFKESDFTPTYNVDFPIEILGGVLYEFEHFSVVGQYSYIFSLDKQFGTGSRSGISAGIYYPLKKF